MRLPAIPQNGIRKLYLCFVVVFKSFSQNFPVGCPCVIDTFKT